MKLILSPWIAVPAVCLAAVMLISGITGLVFLSTAIVAFYSLAFVGKMGRNRQLTADRIPALLVMFAPICIAWGTGFYFAWEKEAKYHDMTTAEIRAENAKFADVCTFYWEMNLIQRELFARDDQWCKVFPEVGSGKVAAVSIDTEATGSTEKSPNGLWK